MRYGRKDTRRAALDLLQIVAIAAALLCGLVAGLVFGFAVVAMPGIGALDDEGFLRSFAVMDRVIQDGRPLFMIVWLGSALAVIATAVIGAVQLEGSERVLAVAAAAVYLIGVQLPTAAVNIPLNNSVQELNLGSMDEDALREARRAFEPRWNRWNRIRTAMGTATTVLLLVLLARLPP